MYENNRLTYSPLSWCMSKDDETRNSRDKEDRTLTVDNSGNVRIKNADIKGEADLSTDLLLKFALTRRGLAMEQAGLRYFQEHEKWADRLLHSRYRDVPTGYTRVSVQQLLQADKQLFVVAANECRSGVGVQVTDAGRPLDSAWMQCADQTEVAHLLAPLAQAPPKSTGFERPTPYRVNKGKGKDGKGKHKTRREVQMPADLKDGHSSTPKGVPICFDAQRNKCTRQLTGNKCFRGAHICCFCFQPGHFDPTCPKRKSE